MQLSQYLCGAYIVKVFTTGLGPSTNICPSCLFFPMLRYPRYGVLDFEASANMPVAFLTYAISSQT